MYCTLSNGWKFFQIYYFWPSNLNITNNHNIFLRAWYYRWLYSNWFIVCSTFCSVCLYSSWPTINSVPCNSLFQNLVIYSASLNVWWKTFLLSKRKVTTVNLFKPIHIQLSNQFLYFWWPFEYTSGRRGALMFSAPGTFCCFLRQDTSLSQCLSLTRCIT